MGVSLYPAISQSPGGQLYGWLPLSNAYGISPIATQNETPTVYVYDIEF